MVNNFLQYSQLVTVEILPRIIRLVYSSYMYMDTINISDSTFWSAVAGLQAGVRRVQCTST